MSARKTIPKGRPPFSPTQEQRQLVRNMAGIGCTHEEIVSAIPWGLPGEKPLSEKTLRKHFRAELDRGVAVAKARVRQTLYDMAVSGNNTAATIFYAKTRLGMKETVAVENSGKDGSPLPMQPFLYIPQKDPLPEEQEEIERRALLAASPKPPAELRKVWPESTPQKDDEPASRVFGGIEPLNEHIERRF